MLPLVTSPIARLAIIGAAVAAFGLTCWLKGASHAEQRFEALRAKETAAVLVELDRLARAASEIDVVWVNTTTTVRERAKNLIREVPTYVSPDADARCSVPAGFIRLWNDDLQTEPATTATGGGDDAPSGLALSTVARDGVVEAKERFELNRAALAACQAWVSKLSSSSR